MIPRVTTTWGADLPAAPHPAVADWRPLRRGGGNPLRVSSSRACRGISKSSATAAGDFSTHSKGSGQASLEMTASGPWRRSPFVRTEAGAGSPSVPWLELVLFALVLVLINGPWLAGDPVARWAFLPAAMRAGEWWRVITHPLVHVSWYHLLLDGTAFLLLYASLRERGWLRRLGVISASGAGSLIAACWFTPAVASLGLCGLSGIAHGLMAVTALELIRAGEKTGWVCLLAVSAKALWEAWTGQVLFGFLHFGLMGTPIAVSHLGGVLGAVLAWGTMTGLGALHRPGAAGAAPSIALGWQEPRGRGGRRGCRPSRRTAGHGPVAPAYPSGPGSGTLNGA